jgi:hypothetical protein
MVLALAIGSSSICCLSEPREQHAMSDYETLLVRTAHAVMTVTLSNPPINLETDAMMADLDRLGGPRGRLRGGDPGLDPRRLQSCLTSDGIRR